MYASALAFVTKEFFYTRLFLMELTFTQFFELPYSKSYTLHKS